MFYFEQLQLELQQEFALLHFEHPEQPPFFLFLTDENIISPIIIARIKITIISPMFFSLWFNYLCLIFAASDLLSSGW